MFCFSSHPPLISSLPLNHIKMTDANEASFEAFLQGWFVRQRSFLEELVSAQQRYGEMRDGDRTELINRVIYHYEQYFKEKTNIARHNILLVFSPPWFSSLERTFLWVAGFNPRLALKIVNDVVEDLSEDQRPSLRELGRETKRKESALNSELAKAHESVAASPILDAARGHGRACLGGGAAEEGEVPIGLKVALVNVVASADALRTNTASRIFEILTTDQVITFLVATAELQLRIRSWGLDKDAAQSGEGGGEREF